MSSRTEDDGPIDDELRSGEIGQTVEQPAVDEIFEIDGDTTGTDPGADLIGDESEFDAENLQTSTGGGMGPTSFPPEDDEDFSGNGADRGPS